MSVIIDIAIFPMDKEGTSVSPYVGRVLKVISQSGLPHVPGPMGTAVEGEWGEVMGVVDACYRELEHDCERIYMTLKVDGRSGRRDGLKGKVRSALSRAEEE